MRATLGLVMLVALSASACGASSPAAPSVPGTTTLTGTWVGTSADSSGSMMGAGLSATMMAGTSWTITQTDETFTGTMQFAGYHGGTMTVAGTMTGQAGTFTMTMPGGTMMMGTCMATATGTFDMDDMMTTLHATYAGTNTCTGPFTGGQMSMHR